MKRMHLHVSVDDINQSVGFYSKLFGASPTVSKPDYAKWMLDDPLVNFAISKRGAKAGLDHIGIQVEHESELDEIKARLEKAELSLVTEEGTTCCYAKSDKHWVQDPSGIAWETYRTLASAPTFSGQEASAPGAACCIPAAQKIEMATRKKCC
ncbi:ArsI/CadI family heavy metal resistance metalloenzyme [Methylophilus sp. OH31]|uniref:ArsI/CadI family heavy metal resistance metalloenzyme n=1 Tax=Methylophilus sp. OH31 TaxID=1387312 RepID=UPI0004678290|nr:ArsI/CadI family heavy metal resistance metalloenzyme [Methylophilus sp. OH31]